jgi:GT2 family glycosyltransferase
VNISVVIVSFNSDTFLEDNIDSLIRQTIAFDEIIVVDNCSIDRSLDILGNFKQQIKLISLDHNSGYAGAANIGINASHSDLVVIANPDTIFDQLFNARVMEKFQSDPGIGLLSPLILRFDKTTIDSAGQACSSSLYPSEIGFNQPMEEIKIKEGPVFSVCGAATVFRRSELEKLKMAEEYYDEDFFIFWEDFDIGWRARLLGLKTWFFPGAVVYHYRSGTLKRNFFARFSLALARPSFIKYHLVKNRYLTLIKNFRLRHNCRNIPFMLLKDFIWVSLLTFLSPKIIIPLMRSGKYMKRALKKRKEIDRRINGISDE